MDLWGSLQLNVEVRVLGQRDRLIWFYNKTGEEISPVKYIQSEEEVTVVAEGFDTDDDTTDRMIVFKTNTGQLKPPQLSDIKKCQDSFFISIEIGDNGHNLMHLKKFCIQGIFCFFLNVSVPADHLFLS